MIKINEEDKIKLLNQIQIVRKEVEELKKDLKKMRYFEIELESGERKTIPECDIEIVSDKATIERVLNG